MTSVLRAVARRFLSDETPGPPVGRDAIEQFGWYVLHVTDAEPLDVHMAIQKHLQRPEETIMTTAQRLRREGREEGKAEGKAEGQIEGRAATLLRQLGKRFGALPGDLSARVRGATLAQLERWADRVLDAATLDAVFADEGRP